MSGDRLTNRELVDLFADRLGVGADNDSCDRDLVVAVARHLIADPATSANAIAALVPARRQEVLRVVRELREPGSTVPEPGNRQGGGGS